MKLKDKITLTLFSLWIIPSFYFSLTCLASSNIRQWWLFCGFIVFYIYGHYKDKIFPNKDKKEFKLCIANDPDSNQLKFYSIYSMPNENKYTFWYEGRELAARDLDIKPGDNKTYKLVEV